MPLVMVDFKVAQRSWRTLWRRLCLEGIGSFRFPCGNQRRVSEILVHPVDFTSTR